MRFGTLKTVIFGLLASLGVASVSVAQQNGYSQTNLVSNTAGVANHTDPATFKSLGHFVHPRSTFLDRQQ